MNDTPYVPPAPRIPDAPAPTPAPIRSPSPYTGGSIGGVTPPAPAPWEGGKAPRSPSDTEERIAKINDTVKRLYGVVANLEDRLEYVLKPTGAPTAQTVPTQSAAAPTGKLGQELGKIKSDLAGLETDLERLTERLPF